MEFIPDNIKVKSPPTDDEQSLEVGDHDMETAGETILEDETSLSVDQTLKTENGKIYSVLIFLFSKLILLLRPLAHCKNI